MRIYDIAFYTTVFFILGVFTVSLGLDFLVIITATILLSVLFLSVRYLKIGAITCDSSNKDEFSTGRKLSWLAVLSLLIIAGAFYYFVWDSHQIKNINIIFDKKINFAGLVMEDPERGDSQQLIVKLQAPYSGNVLARVQPYPSFDYGDIINFNGIIQKPEPASYTDYLSKDGIFGIANFPKTELITKGEGSNIRSFLFKLKEKIILNLQKTLSAEKAAFLSGLILGERAEFSNEFKQAMKNSGVTHLVALSGYNITIIVIALSAFLIYFLSRRLTFILTILTILAFVLMTGAEASVVRAAIMGFIALLATQTSRVFSVRNAIVLAAFFMILANPKVLRFDAGFQLSFAALAGIVYLSPAIKKFFKISEGWDFLSLKENFFTTLSAQLAVLPFLISIFGAVSPVSLITNFLILSVVPLTMSLGFILAGLGFISSYLALIFGWFVNLFLSYEILIIEFFGKMNVLQITSLSAFLVILYYFILLMFIFMFNQRPKTIK